MLNVLVGALLLVVAIACTHGGSDTGGTAPTITTHPVSQTVNPDASVTFAVAASGQPTPTFQWERSTDGTTWTALGGIISASHTFTAQISDDGDQFRAVASNGIGTPATSNAAVLTVSFAPVITTHPVSQSVNACDAVSFTVAAGGQPAPTFQWERSTDGTIWTAISGATTASCTFTTQASDNGDQFRAVASNGIGTPVTSNAAVLTVSSGSPVTLTQSGSQTITALSSVSCNSGSGHTENSYYRVFDLATFEITTAFTVTEVQFGIEQATGSGGTQPVTVNLYSLNDSFLLANLTPIGAVSISVVDQVLSVYPVAITGIVPAGSKLVVEILTPNGQVSGALFFIGTNSSPQSAPSYIRAPDCGIIEPTDTAAISFPDMHIVMNVIGAAE